MLAWDRAAAVPRLVGMMALRARKTPGLPVRHLCSQPQDYAFVSNPVIDPDYAGDVMPAFFAEIAGRPDLSNIIRFQHLDGSDPSYAAIMAALAGRAIQGRVLSLHESAVVTPQSGIKRSGSTRKKLRQDWNRLSAAGTVAIVNERSEDAARAGLEVFLEMEAASWKGERGTALLASARDTAFVRRFVAAMAACGNASVALLCLDGKPIAAQVLFYAGPKAYTWKTAYDFGYGRFSPGLLLIDKLTEVLFQHGGTTVINSCTPDGGFMTRIWTDRRPTVDLLVELGPRKSLAFHMIVAQARALAWASAARRRLRARLAVAATKRA